MHNYVINILRSSYKNLMAGRDDSDIHASELADICPRSIAISIKDNTNFRKTRRLSFAEAVTYDIGKAIHRFIKARLSMKKILVGEWTCYQCGSSIIGIKPYKCKCRFQHFFYTETLIEFSISKSLRVCGSLDSIVIQPNGESFFTEIKSIKPDDFDALTEPSRAHMEQVKSYLYILKNSNDPKLQKLKINKKEGVVLYVSKLSKLMPLKSFKVILDEEFVTKIDEKIKELKTFSSKKKMPKQICTHVHNIMAKKCSNTEKCFEGGV